MSLYRVRQQRESAQAAATVFPSSSAPRYRCEPHWLAPSATAFHEPEAPCPPCLGGRLRALPRLAASALPPLPSALPPPRPSSRGLRRAHSAAPAGGAAGGKGGAASMGGTPAEQPKRSTRPPVPRPSPCALPHAPFPMRPSPCALPHAPFPMRPSPCALPHAPFPMRPSPCALPHAPFPMRPSPCALPHAPFPMRPSPCALPHAPFPMRPSPCALPHAPFPMRPSPCALPHAPFPMRPSPCALPHAPFPMCPSPCALPHVPFPMCPSPCALPHVPFPMRPSPCALPHAPFPMCPSPCALPHVPFPMRPSPCALPHAPFPVRPSHAPFLMRPSSCALPHAPFPVRPSHAPFLMRPSPCALPHAPIPMRPSPCAHPPPTSPKVRGADSNSLAMTRQSQRDIWLHQMLPPRACQGRRLLLVPWSTGMYHGVGSQVHLIGAFLGLAMLHNHQLVSCARPISPPFPPLPPWWQVHLMGAFLGLAMLHNHTLIPLANSFDRANHPHCQDCIPPHALLPTHSPPSPISPFSLCLPSFRASLALSALRRHTATGQQGAWECFFFPIVSPDCEDELNRLRAQDAIGECVTGEELGYDRAAQSDQQVREWGRWGWQGRLAERRSGDAFRECVTGEGQGYDRAAQSKQQLCVSPGHNCPSPPFRLFPTSSPLPPPPFPIRLPPTTSPLPPTALRLPLAAPRRLNPWSAGHGTCHAASGGGVTAVCLDPTTGVAVCLDPTTDVFMSYEGRAASLWGDAYLADADMVEHGGHVASTSADTKMVHWWEAQGAPLRLPATYSAPLFPPARCTGGGRRRTVWHRMSPPSTPIDLAREPYMQRPIVSMHVRQSDKLSEMRVLSLPAHMFLAYRLRRALVDLRHVWLNTEAQVGCVWLNTEAQVGDVLLAAVAARPHVPRILPAPCSGGPPTRVAQHGGTGGWDIHSGTHVLCVVDLPGISPTYQCSPLPSTPVPRMAQSVINETAHYPDWHFLFATNARQPSHSERNREYDAAQSVAASLASALIAAQCDVFLGSLGSNWSRLINELRATGGRLYSGFVVMNLGEW
ncbi:unnamed protein product [Closterium sp. Naga37s-1]|nr:unnamed protein product [Closterium sp. Naga37s-1]